MADSRAPIRWSSAATFGSKSWPRRAGSGRSCGSRGSCRRRTGSGCRRRDFSTAICWRCVDLDRVDEAEDAADAVLRVLVGDLAVGEQLDLLQLLLRSSSSPAGVDAPLDVPARRRRDSARAPPRRSTASRRRHRLPPPCSPPPSPARPASCSCASSWFSPGRPRLAVPRASRSNPLVQRTDQAQAARRRSREPAAALACQAAPPVDAIVEHEREQRRGGARSCARPYPAQNVLRALSMSDCAFFSASSGRQLPDSALLTFL